MTDPTCATCRHWAPMKWAGFGGNKPAGICRLAGVGMFATGWSICSALYSCGHHEPRSTNRGNP